MAEKNEDRERALAARVPDAHISGAVLALARGTAPAWAQKQAASFLVTIYEKLGVYAGRSDAVAAALARELSALQTGGDVSPQPKKTGKVKRSRKGGAYVSFRAVTNKGGVWYGGTYDRDKEGRPDIEAARASIQAMLNSIWSEALVRYTKKGSGRFHYHRVMRDDVPVIVEIAEAGVRPEGGWPDAEPLPEWFGKEIPLINGKAPE